jgi:hypothetical protein
MPWIEINELEYSNLCKTIQRAINAAGKDSAPHVLMLCDLLIKIRASMLPDRDLTAAVEEVAHTIRHQTEMEKDGSRITTDCALNAARNLVAALELYGRKP